FVGFSPVSGRSNPMAPPVSLRVHRGPPRDEIESDYHITGTVTFGPAYEGPPGHVHGGLIAAMFDELLGFAQLSPGFTAYLKVDYRKPTPLNRRLDLLAWVDDVDGRKRVVRGTCTLDGVTLSEAKGLFIAPRADDDDYLARLGMAP